MTNSKKTVLAFFVCVSLLGAANASNTTDLMAIRSARTEEVKPGKWHADLNKARAYAEANGMPLVAVWSNGDFCSHCVLFEGAVTSPAFVKWMATSGIVFYFGLVDDGALNADHSFGTGPSPDGQEGYKGTSYYWCRMRNGDYDPNRSKSWPYVRFYWPKGGVDVFYSGGSVCGEGKIDGFPCMYDDDFIALNKAMLGDYYQAGDYRTYNPGGRHVIEFISDKTIGVFRNYSPVPSYSGGEFGVPDAKTYPEAGLQIEREPLIDDLIVPLVRTNSTIAANIATNNIVYQYPSGEQGSLRVVWAKNETQKDVAIPVSAAKLAGDDKYITIVLRDQDNKKKGVIYAEVVDAVANSPKNPLAPGERTIDTLKPGEWTMDIGVATNAVKQWGSDAYTLVLVGGSLWCQDCKNMDANLFGREEFKAWTTSGKKVALVALDTSRDETNDRTLLTRIMGKASGVYVSGAPYISRKGLSTSTAAKVYSRIRAMVSGKFNKLEPKNAFRPGVPTVYVLRSDGSIAGRVQQFAEKSQTAWNENYLKRLDELLAMTSDSDEEQNDSIKTTPEFVSARNRKGLTRTLSFVDQQDCYRIDAPKGSVVSFSISGTANTTNVLSILDATGSVLATASGMLSSGVEIPGFTLESDVTFARVSYPVDRHEYPLDSYYALTKDGSTVSSYTLKSDSVLAPSETETLWEIADGIAEVTMSLIELCEYKFTGLVWDDTAEGLANKEWLEYDDVHDVYTAKDTGAATLHVKENGEGKLVFGYQLWTPGEVAFSLDKWTVKERGDGEEDNYEYSISVQRIGGVSGVAEAEIYLLPAESAAIMDDPTFIWTGDGKKFKWNEGENAAQTVGITIRSNTFADGAQKLVFGLYATTDSDSRVSERLGKFTLTITDNDQAVPGKMALKTHGGAAIPSGRVIVAKGGSTLKLGVVRIEGADGMISGELLVDGAAVGKVEWAGRESSEKTVDVTLPAYSASGSNVCRIVLAGDDGSVVDYANKQLTVKIIPTDAAEFVKDSCEKTMYRYVATDIGHLIDIPVKKSSLVDESGSKVNVVKISGSLPPGLEWGFSDALGDAGGIYVLGIPTKAGFYSSTYQVVEDGNAGSTVQISITVVDSVDASAATSASYNPYLATTRTISDIMVIDQVNKRLSGLLTLTVPRSGRLSARYRAFDGDTVSLMSTRWLKCDNGDFSTVLYPTDDDAVGEYKLSVVAKADGTVDVEFSNGDINMQCTIPAVQWSEDNPASMWSGYYTVSVPQTADSAHAAFAAGDGYMTLRMTAQGAIASGKMTYAGLLANGKAYSGTGVLSDTGDGKTVWLPIIHLATSDRMSGVLSIGGDDAYRKVFPADGVDMRWSHTEVSADASYEEKLEPFGCIYDADADLVGCCVDTFNTHELTFFAIPDDMPATAGFSRGFPNGWDATDMGVKVMKSGGVNAIKLTNPTAAKNAPGALVFSFNRTTGLVQGSLKLSFADSSSVTASFRGVVMPGWGTAECNTCSDGSLEAIKRPFSSGTCWFNDTFNYTDEKSRARTLSVKRGCPFSIGLEAGK